MHVSPWDFLRTPRIRGQKEKSQCGGRKHLTAQVRGEPRAEPGAKLSSPTPTAPLAVVKTLCPDERSQSGPKTTYNPNQHGTVRVIMTFMN